MCFWQKVDSKWMLFFDLESNILYKLIDLVRFCVDSPFVGDSTLFFLNDLESIFKEYVLNKLK